MEEEQPLHGDRGARDLVFRLPMISSTIFFLPLTRYTGRFTTDHHRILLGDCTGNQSNGEDRLGHTESLGYLKSFLVLDVAWNLAFVLVSIVVLLSAFKERPSTPLRIWVSGYALQSIIHLCFVYFEYQQRNYAHFVSRDEFSSSFYPNSIVKRLELMNTIVSFIWWVFGFFWILMGGQALLHDAPRLYWLTVVFLALDVFFIIFCIGMTCLVFFALFCCIPVIAFAIAMTVREGASEADIRKLPMYRFRQANLSGNSDNCMRQEILRASVESGNNEYINELVLHSDDSECCICLSQYVDGGELYALPCNHHFHCGCISKWLRINATCPLCKFNILRADTLV